MVKCNPPNNAEQARNIINSTGFNSCKGVDEESLIEAELVYLALLKKTTILLLVYAYPLNANDDDNRNCILNEERGRLIEEVGSFQENNSSAKSNVLYKGIFVQRGGTGTSAYDKVEISRYCNGGSDSDVVTLSFDYSSQPKEGKPDIFPDSLKHTGTCIESEERGKVIKILPSKENNSSTKSYEVYKRIFVQGGSVSSSAPLEIDKSRFCNGGRESSISTLSWQLNGSRPEIFQNNSEHNSGKIELLINLNDTGFEKSGFDSFFIFALLSKRFAIIIEEYNDGKMNKNSSKTTNLY
ncbi:uncharacterized protein LOC128556438 isoform X2 [Mercenaria mercenaria]|uniref:uncharacterized protein LOC128556438 isoform X2 n=1 Tax=Mercenaria mercenaria TaxID=6596 RepID=UPI00234F4118|nr:uncharacterized protein LOC128556438 isoform X2 [Mercenaria mercenaria]